MLPNQIITSHFVNHSSCFNPVLTSEIEDFKQIRVSIIPVISSKNGDSHI